jgi:hypothetical protein
MQAHAECVNVRAVRMQALRGRRQQCVGCMQEHLVYMHAGT